MLGFLWRLRLHEYLSQLNRIRVDVPESRSVLEDSRHEGPNVTYRVQAHALLGHLGQERCCDARLVIPQQHACKVVLKVSFPDFLVSVDGCGPLVGADPRHVHAVHEINDG